MSNAFIDKFRCHIQMSAADVGVLSTACQNARDFPARHDLIHEGDSTDLLFIVLSGWACRYQILPEGTRQILAFMMPGDSGNLLASKLHLMDHSIATLTPARVASVPRARFEQLISTRPALGDALADMQLVDEGTLRAWIVSMGRRGSVERVAHLMCELYTRARNIGLSTGDRLELPLTQLVLGDALGLTPVHVNRVLKRLRQAGVMELRNGTLIIPSIGKLANVAGFHDQYLQRPARRESWLASV